MLTLENFRKKISPTILKRGRDYFHSERIIEIEEKNSFNSTIYEATVKGTKKYKVVIEIDESGEITQMP